MTIRRTLAVTAVLTLAAGERAAAQQAPQTFAVSGFAIEQSVTVPGTPAEAFDAITGDILPWWDHHYSERPLRLYVEPVPGGCFCEVFDSTGAGARHATVIYAKRGEALRFE